MNKFLVITVLVMVLLAPLGLAATIYYEIPATTIDQTYTLNLTIPTWIKIKLDGLVPNTTMDNLGLSFRDSLTNEILIIFIKTSGYIHLMSPYFNVTDTQLGQWENGTEIYIHFDTDRITVYLGYPTTTNISYSFSASGYGIYDVRVHSNDDTHQAFLSGTIILEETTIVDISEMVTSITNVTYSMIPLIIGIIGIAIPLMFMKVILKWLSKIF